MLHYKITTSEYGLNVLQVSFPGQETIEIDLTDFYKDQSHLETLYDPINEYIATLPEHVQREVYTAFYKVYSQDYKARFEDPSTLAKMEVKIKHITDVLNYENFKMWINHQQVRIIYPDNILEDYVHDQDMNTTKDKTYVKQEYTDLIAYILFIRMLSPIYLDFYNYIKQITPHYYYKIYMLFVRSYLVECKEVLKLRQYIDVNQQTLIGTSKNENIILFAGLSDDDILDSLLSEVVFNKLLTIDFFHKKCNIISFVFQTIKYKGNYTPSSGVAIRGKSVANSPVKEDISYFEDYRKTSDIPIGTVVEIQHSLTDINFLVQALGLTDFDYQAYAAEIENIKAHMTKKMDKTQVYLLGWFMQKIINPRALHYIEYRKLVELMLFAKVVLISKGYYYIAMLLSAERSEEAGYLNVTIRNSMSKATVRKLANSYSFTMEEEKQSVIEKTILELSKSVYNSSWFVVGTAEQLKLVPTNSGYLIHPTNLIDMILDYVELVNSDTI